MLEIGTSNGYSTLWLADAARDCGGSLTSLEIDPGRLAEAERNLGRAGLDSFVELRLTDAGKYLAEAADAAWDLVFLDAERPAYVGYWPDLLRTLGAGGMLVVDNVISHAQDVAEFRRCVEAEGSVMDALVPIGAGALVIVKRT